MTTAKLFWAGRSQAVRLPKEFRFRGGEVRIRRHGNAVILEPSGQRAAGATGETRARRLFSMTRYLLDANAVITLLNDKTSNAAQRLRREKPDDVAIPAIVVHESCLMARSRAVAPRRIWP
jgi:virulence-associated protein VagC